MGVGIGGVLPYVKLLQHSGVQDTELANALLLASQAQVDGGGVASEEGLLVELLDPVAVGLAGVLGNVEIGALASEAFLVGDEGGAQHEQDTVEQTVNHLEATCLAAPGGGEVTLVASLALERLVLEGNVGDLKDLDGDTVALVLTDGLEETGEERGADNLVLGSLGVGEADDGVAVVLAVEPGEVLVVAAKDERHDLAPAGHSSLNADDVSELVDHKRCANSGATVGRSARQVVVTVADGQILHDVALVQNVGTGGRNDNLQEVGVGRRGL